VWFLLQAYRRRLRAIVASSPGWLADEVLSASQAVGKDRAAVWRATADGEQPPHLVVGGGQIDEEICRYVGADDWRLDAMDRVHPCQRLMAERRAVSDEMGCSSSGFLVDLAF
jgi:hypothetical protein